MAHDIPNLMDPVTYKDHVPHEYFAELRGTTPVALRHDEGSVPYWAVMGYDACVRVNREWEEFSSHEKTVFLSDADEALLAQQQQMMINMDPPSHTQYRRLVNKAFTPRMVRDLEARLHVVTDELLNRVCEQGSADFVVDIAAELPLTVIAELMGVPFEDRHKMFDWSNKMIGSEDPEYVVNPIMTAIATMELFGYASELFSKKRTDPQEDLMSALVSVDADGESLDDLELALFFLLLSIAGNETTRNLIAGAMHAFFEFPEQWELLRADRSLMPGAVEEMLRFVTPVMCFRRTAMCDVSLEGAEIQQGDKVVFFHISANRDEQIFENPDVFDIRRTPNPHIAFGGGGPHFCLGANLARMEIAVMFEHLLDRMPEIRQAGPAARLQSPFINGIKHLEVTFPAHQPVTL